MYCRECGTYLPRDSRFCSQCGSSQQPVPPPPGQPSRPNAGPIGHGRVQSEQRPNSLPHLPRQRTWSNPDESHPRGQPPARRDRGLVGWLIIGSLWVMVIALGFQIVATVARKLDAQHAAEPVSADSRVVGGGSAPTALGAGASSQAIPTPSLTPTPKATSTPIPTVAPIPTPTPKPAPLQLLGITTKDAGIGAGSLYAYVEIRNRSDRLFSYVGLDGTCRDAGGRIVGRGLGNTANLSAGESTVITVIFLNAQGCIEVDVEPDALTRMMN